jgi:hypothetical protein
MALFPLLQRMWTVTKWLFLVVFAGIAGAWFGRWAGMGLSAFTGEQAWVAHGRCAGWTLFAIVAAVGGPLGFVTFGGTADRKKPGEQPARPTQPLPQSTPEPTGHERFESRFKAAFVGPLVGALMGLFLGGMALGYLIAVYFFAALSPIGPGGWWPMLELTSTTAAGGFSSNDPLLVRLILIVLSLFVFAGTLFGLFGTTSVGDKRYRLF